MTEWELNVLQTTKGPFLDRLEKKTVGEITPSKVGNNVQVCSFMKCPSLHTAIICGIPYPKNCPRSVPF